MVQFSAINVSLFQLTAVDWKLVDKILIVLKPLYNMTLTVQSETMCIVYFPSNTFR